MSDVIRPDFDDPSRAIDLMDVLIDAKRKLTQAGGDPRNEQYNIYVDRKKLAKVQKLASEGSEEAQNWLKILRPIGEAKD